jgi:CheY-like chemotaxis protein
LENGKNNFRKLNLLLVEDDDINAKIIIRFLKEDYNIDWVKSGNEAIDLSIKKKFDALLMDISLKGELDGLMTTGRIKKLPGYESTPIIAVTAFAMVGDKERFLNGGCSHYISKPFTKPELLFLLKKIFI